jgi:hypothetical protein
MKLWERSEMDDGLMDESLKMESSGGVGQLSHPIG